MYDQRPCAEFACWREMVDDPLTAEVMKADRVDREALVRLLDRVCRWQGEVNTAVKIVGFAA